VNIFSYNKGHQLFIVGRYTIPAKSYIIHTLRISLLSGNYF